MNCPVCSKVLPDRTTVCPECHADLSKWHPKKETGKAAPAVILRQKEVFMWSSLLGSFDSFRKPLIYTAVVCVLLYGAYRGYIAYVLRADNASSSAEVQAPADQQSAAEQLPVVQLSTAGFVSLYQEYTARAAALNVPALEQDATNYFQAGVNEIENMGFAAMAEAGMNAAEEPLTQEELGRAGQENFGCKCLSDGATEYLAALPDNNRGRSACWELKPGPGAAAEKSAPAESKWVQTQWLTKLRRWSPWTAEQLIGGAEKYAERAFAPAVLQEETARTEALVRKLKRQKRKPAAGTDAAFFETYKARFRREGALAAIERLRAMAGIAPQTAAQTAPVQAQ